MYYDYNEQRKYVFTEEGSAEFLKVRDNVKILLESAGCFTMTKALTVVCGNGWKNMALVDRLLDLGEIREIEQIGGCYAQNRIFVSGL